VVVGIRAEDVRVTQEDGPPDLQPAEVMEVESLGDSSLVHVTWAKQPGQEPAAMQMVAKVEGREAPAIGQRVRVSLNASRLHLFDAASGERLPEA
jgi:multiple sugar transport system ATP-binding protein